MKKMLLASDGGFLFAQGYNLLGIPMKDMRIGYVITASKGVADLSYLERLKASMQELGLNFEEIDIEGKTKDELYKFFEDKNVIHVEGGNTYYLIKTMKQNGCDQVLKDLVDHGKIYVGTSAGASIAGPRIDVSTWVPEGAPPEDLEALNLVPFTVKSHYTPERHDEFLEMVKKTNSPVRILRDGQGILVEDDTYKFVGEGEEIKL